MKKQGCLLGMLLPLTVVAGQMGPEPSPNKSYAFIAGGYYSGLYQKVDTDYDDAVLESMTSADTSHSDGYGQVGVGMATQIDKFVFDHQLSILKLGGTNRFTSPHSTNALKQNIDFGYDFLPKIDLFKQFYGFGILGVHYGRFQYEKEPRLGPGVAFNIRKDQIGFDLGAGINYQINEHFTIGAKYQHLQYKSIKVSGTSSASNEIDAEQFTPAFNLVGGLLRYYW